MSWTCYSLKVLPSSLFNADVGVVVDMSYKHAEMPGPLLRLASRQVAPGDGDQCALRAGSQEIRGVDAEVLEERDAQNGIGRLWRPTTGPQRPSRLGQG